ncbi:MAG TPA: EamA family transporter RarD [Candidatus Krumholzibacteria bacterium]|nr:EamA family transporter RarD [Candidatus Krumholzibacteria bacterium]
MNASPPITDPRQQRLGVVYGASAYLWWGFIAVYFKVVGSVAPVEILAHRVVWSLLFLGILLGARRRLGACLALLRDARTTATMALTAILIAANWGLFIWAVGAGRLVEASLGYFINPLVNVMLGVVFLGERLRRAQAAAVALAAAAVAWLTVSQGRLPWIALVLAFSFGTYGLLRKRARPSGVEGLALETLLMAPLAVAFLVWRDRQGLLAFGHAGWGMSLLLALAGPVTALPLVWFAEGARRLRYATMGFLQYVTPTLQFLLAVVAFGEPFARGRALGFVLIWTALALYTVDTARSLARR